MKEMQRRQLRKRDEKGRFLPEQQVEELQSYSIREIKLVKVKGTHGTYLVRTKRLSDADKDLLIVSAILGVLAIIF